AGCYRSAGGDGPRSVQLPVPKYSFQKRFFGQERFVRAERQLNVVVQVQAVRLIQTREASFCPQIERILRDSAPAASTDKSRRIRDGFRELIGSARGNSAPQPAPHPNCTGMPNRIRCGGCPIERLYVRDAKAGRGTVRRLNNIESSSFGARVIQIDLKAKLANVALHIQVPLLRVSDAVIGINAIVVRDRAWKRRKSILQRQQFSIRIRLRERKWRVIFDLPIK